MAEERGFYSHPPSPKLACRRRPEDAESKQRNCVIAILVFCRVSTTADYVSYAALVRNGCLFLMTGIKMCHTPHSWQTYDSYFNIYGVRRDPGPSLSQATREPLYSILFLSDLILSLGRQVYLVINCKQVYDFMHVHKRIARETKTL